MFEADISAYLFVNVFFETWCIFLCCFSGLATRNVSDDHSRNYDGNRLGTSRTLSPPVYS